MRKLIDKIIKWHKLKTHKCFDKENMIFIKKLTPIETVIYAYYSNGERVPISLGELNYYKCKICGREMCI